ncbi:hypothetical protein D1007_12826 [Hordeum vulgare]|nr:hypothetical protein D1007_12826 [Hordeum vulgare]
MTALMMPLGVIQEMDKRCRAFFWVGQDKVSGGQCKVAWDFVCASFSHGGLGFSSLHHLNSCLLFSHITKLHSATSVSSASHLATKYSWSETRDLDSPHPSESHIWRDIAKGLSFFRSIIKVQIGNGKSTAFWLDHWVPNLPQNLVETFPALFSHALRLGASVARTFSSPDMQLDLAPRLSHAAVLELENLRLVLAVVTLDMQVHDRRTGRIDGKPLTCNSAYKAIWSGRPVDHFAPTIWKNYGPNKCRIFLWLAGKNCLFTNNRRFNTGLTDSCNCPFCPEPESTEHFFLHCGHLRPLWQELTALSASTPTDLRNLWGPQLSNKTRSTVIIAVLWNIWKRRNAKAFR